MFIVVVSYSFDGKIILKIRFIPLIISSSNVNISNGEIFININLYKK